MPYPCYQNKKRAQRCSMKGNRFIQPKFMVQYEIRFHSRLLNAPMGFKLKHRFMNIPRKKKRFLYI